MEITERVPREQESKYFGIFIDERVIFLYVNVKFIYIAYLKKTIVDQRAVQAKKN